MYFSVITDNKIKLKKKKITIYISKSCQKIEKLGIRKMAMVPIRTKSFWRILTNLEKRLGELDIRKRIKLGIRMMAMISNRARLLWRILTNPEKRLEEQHIQKRIKLGIRKLAMIPIRAKPFWRILANLEKIHREQDIRKRFKIVEVTSILRLTWIVRRLLESWCYLSLKLQ